MYSGQADAIAEVATAKAILAVNSTIIEEIDLMNILQVEWTFSSTMNAFYKTHWPPEDDPLFFLTEYSREERHKHESIYSESIAAICFKLHLSHAL